MIAMLPTQSIWAVSLIGETTEDEIELGVGVTGARLPAAWKQWLIQKLELQHLLSRDVRTLSGGEIVRVALAILLARKPEILVIDQTLDACDPDARRQLRKTLAEWLQLTNAAIVEFATSWRDQDVTTTDSRLIVLTKHGYVTGLPAQVWKTLGDSASDFFEGLPGLAAQVTAGKASADLSVTIDALARKLAQVPPARTDDLKRNYETSLLLENLDFVYESSNFRLLVEHLALGTGECTAVVGPNGAGKTTLLRCLGNLIGPWRGHRAVHGAVLPADVPLHRVAQAVLYAFQNPDDEIYRGSVHDELFECRRNLRPQEDGISPIEQLILEDLGFDPMSSEPPFSLSLSRRRLLIIASTLLARTRIVLLDEPTAWLDPLQKRGLGCALRRFLGIGGTILMVSHDLDFIGRSADRVVTINNGRQLPETVSEMLQTPAAVLAERAGISPMLWKESDCLRALGAVPRSS